MSKVTDFIHLHCHSEYSMLDGMPRVKEYIDWVVELGQGGIALTEHGNCRSLFELHKYATEAGVKPISGIEFYLSHRSYKMRGAPDSVKDKLRAEHATATEAREAIKAYEEEQKLRARYHLLAFAKNEKGLENLFILHYLSWRDGFYYRPRIDLPLLLKYKEGLIVTSACVGSPIGKYIMSGDVPGAERLTRLLHKYFGEDFYLELQPHNFDEQKNVNETLIHFAEQYKIKLIATNDTHYLKQENQLSHEVMLAIQSHEAMQSADRWRFPGGGYYIRTKDEMQKAFQTVHGMTARAAREALENTAEIADKCNVTLEMNPKKGILPKVDRLLPKGKTPKQQLLQIVKDGWKWRGMSKRIAEYARVHNITKDEAEKVYKERMRMELQRIFELHFESYFLVVHDYINWARNNGILVGPGRGSSGGSLVAFLMGITAIDSVRHDLMFDRFLDPNRVDFPDIDTDFQKSKRHLVVQYLEEKYGKKFVANIMTAGRMKGKAVLLDVARVYEVPQTETHKITKYIPKRFDGDDRADKTVEDAFAENAQCKDYNERHPEVYPHAVQLEGKARNIGVHAAGVQITPKPIYKMVPVEFNKDGIQITSLNWKQCAELGLIKFDLLGLLTLDVLATAREAIKERHGVDIDFEALDLELPEVLAGFRDRRFRGIFQFDSHGMKKTCEGLKFPYFIDIAAMNALYRPGPLQSGIAEDYTAAKRGERKPPKVHPLYDAITKDTEGQIIYQEQLIKTFADVGLFDNKAANRVRKTMSKSAGKEALAKEHDEFIAGAKKNKMKVDRAEKLFEEMSAFGKYAFNKSHAVAYGIIAYWTMYLKVHYTTEFYYALMAHAHEESDSMQKLIRYVREARAEGVTVKTPNVNDSKQYFSIDKSGAIVAGLLDIKGCGEKAAAEIAAHAPYESLQDMRARVNARIVNRGVIKALAQAGALSPFYRNIKALTRFVPQQKKKRDGTVEETMHAVYSLLWDGKLGEEDYNTLSSSFPVTEEEEANIMQGVCPIPSHKHKLEYYIKYLERMKLHNLTDLSSIEEDAGNITVAGIISDVDYDKRTMSIEDGGGALRVFIDPDVFEMFADVIARDTGTPVAIYGTYFSKGEAISADIIVDLDDVKAAFDDNDKKKAPSAARLLWRGNLYIRSIIEAKRKRGVEGLTALHKFNSMRAGRKRVAGVVTRVKEHVTKKGDVMAFVNMYDGAGTNFIVWPDTYEAIQNELKPGRLVEIVLRKDSGGVYAVDGTEAKQLALVYKRHKQKKL